MGMFSVLCSLTLLMATSGEDTTLTLADVARLLQQSQTALVESINRQQQSMAENIQRQQQSIVENVDLLTAKVNDLTDQFNQLKGSQDAGSSAKKRLVLNGEIDVQQAIVTLEQKIQALQSSSGPGAVYIRWGRTTCPGNGTELVYAGYAGGSYYTSKGGGSNYLCLPSDPKPGYTVSGKQTGADVYGAEFEFGSYTRSQWSSFFGSVVAEDDVPCSVCRSNRPSSVMIPGRNICYPGWSMEYTGYIMGEYSGHDSSEFVCMDGAPEGVPGGRENKDGVLFYIAEVNCGSLTCPPYTDGQELSCVVCSK